MALEIYNPSNVNTLVSEQNKFIKINSVANKDTAFAILKAAIEAGVINVTVIGDSISTVSSANALSQSEQYWGKLKDLISAKYSSTTIAYTNLAIGGTSIQEWNALKTINSVEKTWIEHVKDSSPDLLIIGWGMNNTDYATAKQFKYNLKSIIDYIVANFTKMPSIMVVTTPRPVQQEAYNTSIAQNSRDLAAFAARCYGFERGCYIVDVNRLYNIMRNGFDPIKTRLKTYILADSAVSGTYATNGNELVFQTSAVRMDLAVELKNFKIEFEAKFSAFPSGTENLTVSCNNTTDNVMDNRILLFPNATNVFKIKSYGNNPDSAELGATETKLYAASVSYSDDIYRKYAIEKINNIFKFYIDDLLILTDPYFCINNLPAKISLKKDAGSTGVATIKKDTIKLWEYEYETYSESMTDEDMYGKYVSGDTSTKSPYGGNGINHPSSIGINQVYVPALREAVEDMPVIELNKVKNITKTVTTAEIVAGKTLIPAIVGRQITPLRYFVKSTGDFSIGGGTNVVIQDTNATPVIITTIAKAALTDGAKISSNVAVANVTDGAGMLAPLTVSKGIAIPASAGISNGTSVKVSIDYIIS